MKCETASNSPIMGIPIPSGKLCVWGIWSITWVNIGVKGDAQWGLCHNNSTAFDISDDIHVLMERPK